MDLRRAHIDTKTRMSKTAEELAALAKPVSVEEQLAALEALAAKDPSAVDAEQLKRFRAVNMTPAMWAGDEEAKSKHDEIAGKLLRTIAASARQESDGA